MIYIVLLIILEAVFSDNDVDLRTKRYGSNCVVVESGVISPYYSCTGCVIEEAMGW